MNNNLSVPTEAICRICVEESLSAKRVSEIEIECDNVYSPMIKVLRDITGFEIVDVESNICLECIEKATVSFKFKLLCEKSNEKYQKYLQDIKVEISEVSQVKVEDAQLMNEIRSNDPDDCEDDIPLIYLTYNESKSDSDESFHEEKIKEMSLRNKLQIKKPIKNRKLSSTDISFGKMSKCKFCNKVFKNKYVLMAHEKRHENKGKFICNECGKGFDSKGCLSRHIRVHTGEKKFQCKECNRCFPSANNLRLHSRRHNGIKPYLCTQCGKSFSHPTGLSYHLRTHTRERPYTCEICGKSFLIQCHLDRHKKIHTGERPFACSQCEKAFIKKIDLQRHEAIHSGEKPHICKICNKSFLRILHLNYHMMVHTSERPHRCSYCGKGFIRRYYLTDHIKKRHTEDFELDGDLKDCHSDISIFQNSV